jgi:hypothetical protein
LPTIRRISASSEANNGGRFAQKPNMVCLSREEQNVDAKTPEKEIVLSTGLNQFQRLA